MSSVFGTRWLWRGYQVSCYLCHDGPSSSEPSPNHLPVVVDVAASTTIGYEVSFPLQASDPDGNPLVLRVVGQPAHGAAWIGGTTAHYRPEPGFIGDDLFTFAAWDGWADSNLGTARVAVGDVLFADGFEAGDTSAWSWTTP